MITRMAAATTTTPAPAASGMIGDLREGGGAVTETASPLACDSVEGPAVPALLRSHPASDERQRALAVLVPTLPRGQGGAGPTLEALKTGCRN